ncbi:zf-HC2 domain-containing protein [Streptomyces sp. Vc74B-19]|uniref:zf-HC2 domain-containing protein n=1 Tax=unclassified Streptomyces TaxID=2593676 RepID=UPI001BFC0C3A|nr:MULTISPECIES: zf-HC2 domain-containing protein [unclassified Streptomyces]MBT3166532.1 zf-HC2 domain-containing protein [Streptomyces sp. Vc74B-19]MCO4700210.1 zf-HC2 domain-containing protein [Streptomyces sp. RO-S4]MDU0301599.1 zf-HC2 domain-containing protein [Streptomyces sp. PAL114]
MTYEDKRWHVPEDDLRAYARAELEPPALWSADTHLTACAHCRAVLAALGDPVALDTGWERLDAELDAPRPGLLEALLLRIGVADHTARLLVATPALRRSWLGAVAAVLVLTVAVTVGNAGGGRVTLFLALAPLLPLVGVALSYGPAVDPTYEMAVVAPMHGFRLLMIRTVAVLSAGLGLNGLATLALPGYGLLALSWLLPALALITTALALSARLGPVLAPSLVGGGWIALLLTADAVRGGGQGTLAPFTAAGQGVSAAVAVLAAGLLVLLRDRFDLSRDPAV